jgi:hypothetical protein
MDPSVAWETKLTAVERRKKWIPPIVSSKQMDSPNVWEIKMADTPIM